MTHGIQRLAPSRALRVLTLSMALWISGAGLAQAADALIVSDSSGGFGFYPIIVTHLTTYLTAASYTVTSVTAVPGDLSAYAQVWDVRFDNTALAPSDQTIYATYLASGGSLFLMGENTGFNTRNNSVVSFVASLGGGALGAIGVPTGPETVQAPFTGPNVVTTVTFNGSGKVSTPGTGLFFTSGGTALVFGPGTLTGVTAGALIVVFDVNTLIDVASDNGGNAANVILFIKNIIAYLAAPTILTGPSPQPPPAPPPPTASAPTITGIANQVVPVSASTTVSFTVGGAVIFDALTVRVSTSNPTFVPMLTLKRLDQNGHWTLTLAAADGRAGTAVITLTVSDTTRETSTSFTLSTSPLLPSAPANLVASASGSGIALTWSAPNTGAPAHYVITSATTPGGSNVSVFVTPDGSTSYILPMVMPGTYYFRVQAVGDAVGPASNEASVAAAGSTTVAGVPTGVVSTVDGSNVTLTWNPPAGPSPTLYVVEFGTAAGSSDVAIVTAVSSTHTRGVRSGFYFMRVRSFNGGVPSAPSNETSIPAGLGGCSAAPFMPVLLPVSKTGGVVTLSWLPPASWLPAADMAPDAYRIDLTNASGAVTSITTVGAGTSTTWTGSAGTYRARVTATNRCGTGAPSSEVSFAQ